jgi:hypothetical protein
MTTTISALTTGGGGAVVTGDSSGALALQTNNTVTAIAIDASQNITLGTTGSTTTIPANIVATTSNQTVNLSPTGTGTVAISPVGALTINPTAASTINNTSIGGTTAAAGTFTQVTVNGSNVNTAISPTGTGTVTISPAGALTINPTAASTINNTSIGQTTAAAGSFTTLFATSNAVGSVTAATGGLTAVTAVTGSLTLATGGVTIASQVMAAGSVWRVVAYGTYAAASSANARTLTMSCYWGSTQLTAITTGNVLASTAQTTPWKVEFEITGSSATAAWITGFLSAQVTSATIPLNYIATAASVTGLTTTSTLDFRVGQTGTATSTDTINVHSVTMERIK